MFSVRAILLVALLFVIGSAQAQSGKIVCWKEKSGKTSCGDKVPYEYQDNNTKELNSQGITVKQSDPPLTAEQKKAQQAATDRKQAENQIAEQQHRKDKALLDTFTTANEIDLKRNRDIQLIEANIEAQQTNLKNAIDRQADARSRMEQYKKDNKPVPPSIQDEIGRA